MVPFFGTMHYLSVPLIAGLAVGICLVLLFAVTPSPFSSSTENRFPRDQVHYLSTFHALKSHYAVGEKLNFALNAKVYGNDCGTPNVLIID